MKEIILKQGQSTLVDDEDYEFLSQWEWSLSTWGYASRHKAGRVIFMHRVIMNTPKDMFTDHINRNKLDNQRKNLRICTKSQNNSNSKMRSTNKSGYKGVSWDKKSRRWRAQIRREGKTTTIGWFDYPADAARVYDSAALEIYGEFAHLNFPNLD